MPHRQLLGTFRPCGTIARYSGREEFKKSLHLRPWDSAPSWPRPNSTVAVSSILLGKPYHSHHALLPGAALHKIQDMNKICPAGAPPQPPPETSCIATSRRARPRTGDMVKKLHKTHKRTKLQGDAAAEAKGTHQPAQKTAVRVPKITVRVLLSITQEVRARDMDYVLLLVPTTAPGEKLIELTLAARDFDSAEEEETEDPNQFDLLRLRPAPGPSTDKFRIGSALGRTQPVGDAGTRYFVLYRNTE